MENDATPGEPLVSAPAGEAIASAPAARGMRGRLDRLGRDFAYVLPGLPIAALSFAVLVALTLASLVTLVAWIGGLLMPLTLVIASAFARLSRLRLRAWGNVPAPVEYRPVGRGLTGVLQIMTEPRRWLDLTFETLIAFPLRLLTFVIAVTWTAVALGGITHWLWWRFVPAETSAVRQLLSLWFPDVGPRSERGIFLLDSGLSLLLGVLFLLTLPTVMSGLARFDALLTSVLLGGSTGRPRIEGGDGGAGDGPAGSTAARPMAFDGAGWAWASTSIVAVVLFIVAWPVLAAVHGVHPALALALAAAHCAAGVLALRSAPAGIALATLAAGGAMLATSAGPWPWPVTAMLAQCLLVAIIAVRCRWPWAVAAWSTGALLSVAALVLLGREASVGGAGNAIVLASVSAVVAALGALARLWRQNAHRARQAELTSAAETQRRRYLEDRNRIARELHDVVAHSMSVINVQASTAQYRKAGIDDAVQQEFDDIASASRRALGEMRALLAVLRGDDSVPTAPVPDLTDIPDLVEATRAAGARINYSIEADAPPTVALTAYRVIQEALSNALRHSPGAPIDVSATMDEENNALRVEVVNSAPDGGAVSAPGSGLGLAGIAERVQALGGSVESGTTPSGGFCVVALIPLDAVPEGTH